MNKSLLLGSAAIALLGVASPSTLLAAAPQEAVAQDLGILVFTPDYFAQQRPVTALDMVNRIPGFSVDDGDGARGFEGAVGNVLINGSRPASKNDLGSTVLGRTLAGQVERIELIRGGASGIDMQGFSVVVNVITKASASSRQHIVTGTAMLFEGGQDLFGGSYQFTARNGERTWGFTLSDSISTSDSNGKGPVTRYSADGELLRAETYFNDAYGGGNGLRGNYTGPLMGGTLDLTARIGVNDWHNIDRQSAPNVFREALYDDDTTSGELGIVYSRPLGRKLKLETRLSHEFADSENISLSRIRLDGEDSPEQRFTADSQSSESIIRSLIRYERREGLEFELGGELAYNMLDAVQVYEVGGVNVPLPSASIKVEETRGEVFAKSTWRINPRWSLESGLRLEASRITQSGDAANEKEFFFAKPRLLVSWTPSESTQVRLRFERVLGQLDFGDFAASSEFADETVLGGNVNLEPEARWVSELTFEKRFWEQGIISLGLRHDEIDNAIDVIPLEGGLTATGNIGKGTQDQLAFNLVVPTDRLGIKGGRFTFRNTWIHTEVTDPTTGEIRRSSNVRPSQANFGWQQDMPGLKLQWGAFWIPLLQNPSYRPDQLSGFKGRDYLEFWAEYKPTPQWSIRGQVNIWDDFSVYRTVYADRAAGEVLYSERRDIDPRTFYQIRIRRTF